jgi:hypothetical protein
MKLHLPHSVLMVAPYHHLWRLDEQELFVLLYELHHLVTGNGLGCYPELKERLHHLWVIEEQMPVELRRLYYRELYGPASRFDENNGNCLGSDAYEWCLIHPTAKERARALCATYLIAMIKQLYDEGVDHPILDHLRDQFSDQASEAGATMELDHDPCDWVEKSFNQLFEPLGEGYRP